MSTDNRPILVSSTPARDAAQAKAVSQSGPPASAALHKEPASGGRVREMTPAWREQRRILPPRAASLAGGAYRMLRTQVLTKLDALGANTLMILSPTAGAGKTLTAINLAIAIAADPDRTALLVDFDLRNPSIHTRLGFPIAVGIEDCIETKRDVSEAMIQIAGYERLTVLPARQRIEHSSDVLGSHRTAEIVAEMRERYRNRVLIFDMAPVLQADDALAFARNAQAGLLVVGECHTKREEVTRTLEVMRELTVVGTVLNNSIDDSGVYY